MGKQSVYDLRIDSSVSPERLLAAATNFSEHRPDLWPGITRKQYRVYSLGSNTAEVEEGTSPVHLDTGTTGPTMVSSAPQRSTRARSGPARSGRYGSIRVQAVAAVCISIWRWGLRDP
jgi:hypothetical protein